MPVKPKKLKFEFSIGGKKRIVELEPGIYHIGRKEGTYDVLAIKNAKGEILHEFGKGSANAYVSRKHVEFKVKDNGEVVVKDISKNATFLEVGGEKKKYAFRLGMLNKQEEVPVRTDMKLYLGPKAELGEEFFYGLKEGIITPLKIKKIKKELGLK